MATVPTRSEQETPANRQKIVRLRRALLGWYDRHGRQLPWRCPPGGKPDPYHILVSEAMLQQTQVATVLAYFQRFVQRFPTVESLAAGDEQQVLGLWQGLGYYRRARHLHAAAGRISQEYGGRVPHTVEQLLSLPGVGRYTAGAIASIAYNQPAPILDGNVARVLARWHAIEQPVGNAATRTRLWALAAAHTSPTRPGDFNQAMMDLGATVCTPRSPSCDGCPVVGLCLAHRSGRTSELPVVTPRPTPRRVGHHVVVIERRGCFLFQQRADRGLWSAMWQMPTMERDSTRRPAVGELQRWVASSLGLSVTPPSRRAAFTHQTTHRTIEFVVWNASVSGGRLRRGAGCWKRLGNLDELPLANPQRRVVEMVSTTKMRSSGATRR